MKKWILLAGILFTVTAGAEAQVKTKQTTTTSTSESGTKTKVKPKTTVGDKAYNAVHRKKKRSHGMKTKTTSETTIRKDE
ncbi:hypothetical protein [Flaviaesturariibacter terrae]